MQVPCIVLGTVLLMLAYECTRPGRRWPQVAGWWLRAALLNGVQAGTVLLAGLTWDRWFASHRLWSADGLGVTAGAVVGYVVITFVYYWWHRWRYSSALLWRWLHQVHHSPQRLEVITSFYKHPLEIVVNSMLSSALVYLVVGVGPAAATAAVLLTGLAELFYHWNVATPYWLGYLIQRPQSHGVHHQEGVHAYNDANLPLWDMLFGTWYNPRHWEAHCGFGAAREARLWDMLRGVDVNITAATGEAA